MFTVDKLCIRQGKITNFYMYNAHPHFAQTFGEKLFVLIFNSIFIYLYLDTHVLYYKGILAFTFEHIMVEEVLCNK